MTDDRTDPQYKLRWPPDLRDRIQEAARRSGRSINAEIAFRLEWSLNADAARAPQQYVPNPEMDEILASIRQIVRTTDEINARQKAAGLPDLTREEMDAELKRLNVPSKVLEGDAIPAESLGRRRKIDTD